MAVKIKIFKNGAPYFAADNFNDLNSAIAWAEQQKSQPYWDFSTTYIVEDTTAQEKAITDQLQADRKARLDKVKGMKGNIKTLSDALAALDAIIDALN